MTGPAAPFDRGRQALRPTSGSRVALCRSRGRIRWEESVAPLLRGPPVIPHSKNRPDPLPWPREQFSSARWGRAQASRRPAQRADRQFRRSRCLEGHHALGPERVHLLGRGGQAGVDPNTSHSSDTGGAGGRPASALLLARMRAPRAHRKLGLVRGPSITGSPAGVRRGSNGRSGVLISWPTGKFRRTSCHGWRLRFGCGSWLGSIDER
jgi:hypothetical protein